MLKLQPTAFLIRYSPFSFVVWKLNAFIKSCWQIKTNVKFWSFCKLVHIDKIHSKTVEKSEVVEIAESLLTSLPIIIVQAIYKYIHNIYIYIYIYIHMYKLNLEGIQYEIIHTSSFMLHAIFSQYFYLQNKNIDS